MKIFISHSSRDKKFVRTLKDDLNENGFETFLDEDELEIGDSLEERLEIAINHSSHFLIVLSPSATSSSWVASELNQALELMKGKMIEKIIPIKYRRCEIPKELDDLIYADLSDQVVQTEGNKVKFPEDGYSKVLVRLIKTLRSSEKSLNANDRYKLIDKVSRIEARIEETNTNTIKTQNKFIGYASVFWEDYYAQRIKEEKKIKERERIIPITLPSIYKAVFRNLKLGDDINIIKNSTTIKCQFNTYRFKDNSIALPEKFRSLLDINKGTYYNIIIDINSRSIEIS